MSKKFIMINGVKTYIEEENDQAGAGGDAGAGDAGAGDAGDGDSQKDIKAAAKAIGAEIRAELGLDDLKKEISTVRELVTAPENAKLKALLHGKDMVREKDQLTKEEKIVGFFHAMVTRNEFAVKALSEGTAADGGNLFPTEFVSEIVKALSNPHRARSLVTVKTMRRNTLTAPRRATTVKLYWTAEKTQKTTTTATWDQVTLTARKCAAIIYATDELIEDSDQIDVVQEIISQFADAVGNEEDRVIMVGNGTTEPTGINTARVAGTIASVAAGANFDFDDIYNLIYSLAAKYRPGASFLIHPNAALVLRKVKDNNGRYIWQDNPTAGMPASLGGYPVNEFYDLPTSATYFGNWKLAYWLGDRKQMTVKLSQDETTAFFKDETAIRVVFRLGGNVVLGEAAKCVTHAAA